VAEVIPYDTLARQQQLNFLRHKGREYQEREDYLVSLRKLLFQVEAQMRQAEIEQLEVFRDLAAHFHLSLSFPDLGDRVGLQELFARHPFLKALQDYFAGRLSPEECYQRITALQTDPAGESAEGSPPTP
jgi:hypothetical protein